MHPVEAFKAARLRHHEEVTAPEKARRDAVVFAFWTKLRDHAGDALMEHVTVTLKSESPDVFKVAVPDHIPIEARGAGRGFAFTLTRRHERKTFDHLSDALTFGEPYPLADTTQSVLPEGKIDTAAGRA
jgi:hypothetical protein